MTFLIINGPNLNLLGQREKSIYGDKTLADLEAFILDNFPDDRDNIIFFQSNHEGDIVEKIQKTLGEDRTKIIINAGALTHTSVAIRDALAAVKHPFIEVHISNVYARETFRHNSYLSDIAEAVISGLGFHGYVAALEYLKNK
ncbi:MAG: type II 3-dehydroquinate dehydratase [Pseudomonadota bacterium]